MVATPIQNLENNDLTLINNVFNSIEKNQDSSAFSNLIDNINVRVEQSKTKLDKAVKSNISSVNQCSVYSKTKTNDTTKQTIQIKNTKTNTLVKDTNVKQNDKTINTDSKTTSNTVDDLPNTTIQEEKQNIDINNSSLSKPSPSFSSKDNTIKGNIEQTTSNTNTEEIKTVEDVINSVKEIVENIFNTLNIDLNDTLEDNNLAQTISQVIDNCFENVSELNETISALDNIEIKLDEIKLPQEIKEVISNALDKIKTVLNNTQNKLNSFDELFNNLSQDAKNLLNEITLKTTSQNLNNEKLQNINLEENLKNNLNVSPNEKSKTSVEQDDYLTSKEDVNELKNTIKELQNLETEVTDAIENNDSEKIAQISQKIDEKISTLEEAIKTSTTNENLIEIDKKLIDTLKILKKDLNQNQEAETISVDFKQLNDILSEIQIENKIDFTKDEVEIEAIKSNVVIKENFEKLVQNFEQIKENEDYKQLSEDDKKIIEKLISLNDVNEVELNKDTKPISQSLELEELKPELEKFLSDTDIKELAKEDLNKVLEVFESLKNNDELNSTDVDLKEKISKVLETIKKADNEIKIDEQTIQNETIDNSKLIEQIQNEVSNVLKDYLKENNNDIVSSDEIEIISEEIAPIVSENNNVSKENNIKSDNNSNSTAVEKKVETNVKAQIKDNFNQNQNSNQNSEEKDLEFAKDNSTNKDEEIVIEEVDIDTKIEKTSDRPTLAIGDVIKNNILSDIKFETTTQGALTVQDEVVKIALNNNGSLNYLPSSVGNINYENSIVKNTINFQMPQENLQSNEIERSVLNQIGSKISQLQDSQKLTMVLRPNDLGRLSIELVSDKNGLTTHIVAQNEEVRKYIEKNINTLRNQLSNSGVNVNSIQIKTAGEAQSSTYEGNTNQQTAQEEAQKQFHEQNNKEQNQQRNNTKLAQDIELLSGKKDYDNHLNKEFSTVFNKTMSYVN